jgi:hypothetical protein
MSLQILEIECRENVEISKIQSNKPFTAPLLSIKTMVLEWYKYCFCFKPQKFILCDLPYVKNFELTKIVK